MTEELMELIENFNEKLRDAQRARTEVMDYLEMQYDIDVIKECEQMEDHLIWCYGIDVDAIKRLI